MTVDLAARQRELDARRQRQGIARAPRLVADAMPRLPTPQALEIADPIVLDERDPTDPRDTLVQPGEYLVRFVDWDRFFLWKRWAWFVEFTIAEDGPHLGRPLLRFYAEPRGRSLGRSSSLWRDFMRLTGRRPPLAGFKPRQLFGGCTVLARVKTVSPLDNDREELGDGAMYSRIDGFNVIVDGMPPILSGSREGLLELPRNERKRRSRRLESSSSGGAGTSTSSSGSGSTGVSV